MGCGHQDPPRPGPAPSAAPGAPGLAVLAREISEAAGDAQAPGRDQVSTRPKGFILQITWRPGDFRSCPCKPRVSPTPCVSSDVKCPAQQARLGHTPDEAPAAPDSETPPHALGMRLDFGSIERKQGF